MVENKPVDQMANDMHKMNNIGFLELANNVLNMTRLFHEKHKGKALHTIYLKIEMRWLRNKALGRPGSLGWVT